MGANMTCLVAKHLEFKYVAVVDLICFRSTKYSSREFLDDKDNFWRQVCCF